MDTERLATLYDRFLDLNALLKSLSARATAAHEDGRLELLGELDELVERTEVLLASTCEVLPRFGGYSARLRSALGRASEDWVWVANPTVDSVHTIWVEIHEDYLVTLGRSREEESSY